MTSTICPCGGVLSGAVGTTTSLGGVTAARDLRICFLGASWVVGYGDPKALGWVGRVVARTVATDLAVTAYNLGVRGEGVTDLAGRVIGECSPRLGPAGDARVVLQTGSDVVGRPAAEVAADVLAVALDCRGGGWEPLVVGLPPVLHEEYAGPLATLDPELSGACAASDVPFVGLQDALARNDDYLASLARSDGSHPDQVGYGLMAWLVLHGGWYAWLGLPEPAAPPVRRGLSAREGR